MSDNVDVESPRRRLSKAQADKVHRLTAAAEEELLEGSYTELTVRNVARRAGVAPATAYTYFSSKNHLVTELFWSKLHELPDEVDPAMSPKERVTRVLRDIALLMAGNQVLAAACTRAMLGSDPDVGLLRLRIGAEIRSRLESALGDSFDPHVRDALEFAYAGALVQAGMGAVSYEQVAEALGNTVSLILEGRV